MFFTDHRENVKKDSLDVSLEIRTQQRRQPCMRVDLDHVLWVCPSYNVNRQNMYHLLRSNELFPRYSSDTILKDLERKRLEIVTIFLLTSEIDV